jgi:hypothetical protein
MARPVEKSCLEAEAKKEAALVSREKSIVTKRLGQLSDMTLATYHEDDQIKPDYERICGAIKEDVVNGRYELFPEPEIKTSDVGTYEFAKAMRSEYVKYSPEDMKPDIEDVDAFLKNGPSPVARDLSVPMWMYAHDRGEAFIRFFSKDNRIMIENLFFLLGGGYALVNQVMNEGLYGEKSRYEIIRNPAIAVAKITGHLYGIQTGQYAIDFDAEYRNSQIAYDSIKYYELRALKDKNAPHWQTVRSENGKMTKIFVSGEENRHSINQIIAIFPFSPPWEAAYGKVARSGVSLVSPRQFYGRPCLWYAP